MCRRASACSSCPAGKTLVNVQGISEATACSAAVGNFYIYIYIYIYICIEKKVVFFYCFRVYRVQSARLSALRNVFEVGMCICTYIFIYKYM